MERNKKILAIIPARGGSKGIPKKNIKPLDGKPLLYYSIREAKKSKWINRLVVSTEDPEIKKVAEEFGAEVIDRPLELSQDTSTTPDTLIHVINYFKAKENYSPDIVILLQATTPLRKSQDIDKAIELFVKKSPDSVVSVCEAPAKMNPHWVRKIEHGLLKPYLKEDEDRPHLMRQELPKVYWRNGMIYIVKTEILLKTKNLYGDICIPYIMEPRYRINIDEPTDFMLVELLIEKGIIKLN